jgi:hypothetical protein
VKQLVVPYIVFCGIAACVSVATLGQKAHLFVSSSRARHTEVQQGPVKPVKLDGVEFSAEFARLTDVSRLKEKFDENRLERKRLYCVIVLGFCEGTCSHAFPHHHRAWKSNKGGACILQGGAAER